MQTLDASTQQQQQQGGSPNCARLVAAGLAAGVAAAGVNVESHCKTSTYATDPVSRSWWSAALHKLDPRQLIQAEQTQNVFLEEMQDDPKVPCLCKQ